MPKDESSENERLRMKSLPLPEFVQWMIDNKRYDIDPETGVVTNLRTGRVLKWISGSNGYPYVDLTFSRFLQRPIRIHRFIAIKIHGPREVIGKHAAHLDRIRDHSVGSNVALMTVAEHNRYDGHRTKKHWDPCADCGNSDGPLAGGRTPARISGRIAGISGSICATCYSRHYKRARRKCPGWSTPAAGS